MSIVDLGNGLWNDPDSGKVWNTNGRRFNWIDDTPQWYEDWLVDLGVLPRIGESEESRQARQDEYNRTHNHSLDEWAQLAEERAALYGSR